MTLDGEARLFDGRKSAARPVRVALDDAGLALDDAGARMHWRIGELGLQRSIKGDYIRVRLPSGGQVQIDNPRAVQWLSTRGADADRTVRALESRWRYALAAVAAIAAAAVLGYRVGLPRLADVVARRAPASMQDGIGNEALRSLDVGLCRKSALPAERQESVRAKAFAPLLAGLADAGRYRIELRACDAIGPNAFALPEKLIVVTDDLVTLAADDDHVAAVLAHEMGHAEHRHVMRMAVQDAGLAMALATLAGDAIGITSLAVAIPAVLLQAGYSRAFEEEADDFAVRRLRAVGKDPRLFVDMLKRLDQDHRVHAAEETEMDYLATHPAMRDRIERAQRAAAEGDGAGSR